MIAFGRIREQFGKTAGVAKLSDVFQFQGTSPDSLEDKWLRWQKLMRQVNMTSLGDDARETLTIAGLEKAKERALEQHLRPRGPQTWTVLCASVDQYLRTTVDSGSQPTPMMIGAVMSTCACCGKAGHEEARCRFRTAICGKTGHLRAMCRQREKSAGKSSPSSSSVAKAARTVEAQTIAIVVDRSVIDDLIAIVETRIAASLVSVVIFCGMCVDLLVGTQVLGLLGWNPLRWRREKFNTCGHCQSVTFLDFRVFDNSDLPSHESG